MHYRFQSPALRRVSMTIRISAVVCDARVHRPDRGQPTFTANMFGFKATFHINIYGSVSAVGQSAFLLLQVPVFFSAEKQTGERLIIKSFTISPPDPVSPRCST